jgi:hypothetical protein
VNNSLPFRFGDIDAYASLAAICVLDNHKAIWVHTGASELHEPALSIGPDGVLNFDNIGTPISK